MSNQSDMKDSFLHVRSFRKENGMIFSEGDDDFYIVSTGNSEKTCSHCGRIIEQGEPCRMNHKFILCANCYVEYLKIKKTKEVK